MAKASKPSKVAKAPETFDPFQKVKQTSGGGSRGSKLDSVKLDGDYAVAVDEYVEFHEEIKHLEGKKEASKNFLTDLVRRKFAERQMDGKRGNISVLGHSKSVTFIVQNASSALTAEVLAEAKEGFGSRVIDQLTEADLGSLKFNPDFIQNEANQKKLFDAIGKVFKGDELSEMFLPISYKVKSDVVEKAASLVKTAEDLDNLYRALLVKAYIKA